MKTLTPGKLKASFLKNLIGKLPTRDSSIIIPPGIGLDAAGVKIGNQLVAITTDPITFSTNQIGTYSVAVNINDVACLGCKPRWFSASLLLPLKITEIEVKRIWKNLATELQRYNVKAVGGHTEVTSAVNIPIIIGHMIGETIGSKLLNPRDAKPKDKILLWRKIAIEGTALLAKEKYTKLKKFIKPADLKKMQNFLYQPGICILPLVEKLVPIKGLVAIHDPTEGGIATALHEVAEACNCGVKINRALIPIMPETITLQKIFDFDPLGLLASGAALIVCQPQAIDNIFNKLENEPLTVIGELTESKNRVMISNGKKLPLPKYDQDEVINALSVHI